MRIGELSKKSGSPQKTIRFYEQIGLLPAPPRAESGYRDYSDEHLQKLAVVSRAKRLGLSLDEIRQILTLSEGGQTPCVHVERLLQQRLGELKQVQTELAQLENDLRSTLEQTREAIAKAGDSRYCPVIERSKVSPAPLPLAERALKRRSR